MTRIIAGAAGSLRIEVPDSGTRPTSDRARESLFAALEAADAVDGARVLDLYAGSGALALEALSRGASSAELVEKAPRAAAIAARNAAHVARAMHAPVPRVHRMGVGSFLRAASGPWDLVFADPPYDVTEDALADVLDLLAPTLADDALVVVERARRSSAPRLPSSLVHARDRRYGDTILWWVRRRPGG
ncbi:16S rRNA (guanine(966)-N(2))-methyltransferase RsmD [Microbacterium sp. LRZ72]|uniref:16S rRNA (guanine(966)-N(2))-methyltransferase RsmD n=1 Tax=Microbacterium sp. LRZ72 TaxID=2942481 RepID=UPI0029A8CEC6|nr:16S rRNA (guanine(966)-N(2))-methyltransferase RsmD [Microbacterium sp. LRZ72]MDX2375602.1 16S rRNA (guanine(966)-N(2))-methyltransferase RsmD [Microbacterium sp. LRZ72]